MVDSSGLDSSGLDIELDSPGFTPEAAVRYQESGYVRSHRKPTIYVASTNPVKLRAVREAAASGFAGSEVVGVNVHDHNEIRQPIGFDEIQQAAEYRLARLSSMVQETNAVLVSIESGLLSLSAGKWCEGSWVDTPLVIAQWGERCACAMGVGIPIPLAFISRSSASPWSDAFNTAYPGETREALSVLSGGMGVELDRLEQTLLPTRLVLGKLRACSGPVACAPE
jgi:non-canonical (house-cleaning) NTP pyrophosphatase